MIEWISENSVIFFILIGFLVVLVLRDVLRAFLDYKIRSRMKADMAASEKRIDELMDILHKDRVKLMHELAEVDQRFKQMRDSDPNPENPANVKQ